jgi:hypothetical protein
LNLVSSLSISSLTPVTNLIHHCLRLKLFKKYSLGYEGITNFLMIQVLFPCCSGVRAELWEFYYQTGPWVRHQLNRVNRRLNEGSETICLHDYIRFLRNWILLDYRWVTLSWCVILGEWVGTTRLREKVSATKKRKAMKVVDFIFLNDKIKC